MSACAREAHEQAYPPRRRPQATAVALRRRRIDRHDRPAIDRLHRTILVGFAACCTTLCVAVYVVALGTPRGRTFDGETFGQVPRAGASAPVERISAAAVATIDVGSLVLLGGGIVLIALLRARLGAAVAAAVVIAGANLTTQFAKPALEHADPLGGDSLRAYHGSFPSGHATVAMSLALALVIAIPAALRLPAALVGAAYAALVGVSLLAGRWHYASDVAGGYLVAGAWAGVVAAALPPRETPTQRGAARLGAALSALLVGLFLLMMAVAVHRHPGALIHFEYRRHLLFAALALPALALALAATLATLLQQPARRAPPRRR